ncbi:MAG TPA: cysteine desulfurase [Bacillota bacterium]|nr:cysteine desulfurase [Bacillota bacterium]
MSMYDQRSVQQLVNDIYQKGLGAGSAMRVIEREPIPLENPMEQPKEFPTILPETRDILPTQIKFNQERLLPPGPGSKAGEDSSPNYYFLKKESPPQTIANPTPALPVGKQRTDTLPDSQGEQQSIRRDFPILAQKINGHPLIWLDNAATTQKPQCVIDTLSQYYRESNSNVHRGVHTLGNRATDAYETARRKIQQFIGASAPEEIIFLRGTTEAINLVAQTYGRMIRPGSPILLTEMEHHSNIIPWQLLRHATGITLHPIPINDNGDIMLGEYERLLRSRPPLVAVTHVSNVLGTINPIKLIIEMAHAYGARVLIDGAQAVPHLGVNVSELDVDFYTFSGHKIYGPTGIGILYGKNALLEEMPPWQGGGNMIKQVAFDETIYNSLPHKFEAGTGNIADAIGLGTAVDYLQKIGFPRIEQHELVLTAYTVNSLRKIPGLRLFGDPQRRIGVIPFLLKDIDPETLGRRLDESGIAVRAGHHCAQPLMRRYGVTAMARVSLGLYNTREEIDTLVSALKRIISRERASLIK